MPFVHNNHPSCPWRRLLSVGAVLLGAAACHAPADPPQDLAESVPPIASPHRGAVLYQRLCAGCHGLRGAADALPKGTMEPPPLDFSAGLFKLASTVNGIPTDTDLRATLHRGMPGTAMPGFAWLGDEDLDRIVAHVRELAEDELAQRIVDEAEALGDSVSNEQAQADAAASLRPGASVEVPDAVRATPSVLARGKQAFLTRCAACHGPQGTGQRPLAAWAGRMTIQWARRCGHQQRAAPS